MNIWFSFNGVGQIVGGLVAYGIAVGSEKNGSAIAPWKVLFLVTGVLTIMLGLVFLFIVPDSQLNAWWLKKEDRALAVARVRVNQQGIGNKHFKLYQVKEALLDPMTWAFFLYALISDIPNGGLTNFFSQLVRSTSRVIACCSRLMYLYADPELRLHLPAKPPLRRPRRRSRSHFAPGKRLRRTHHPRVSHEQSRRPGCSDRGNGSDRRTALVRQYRPADWVLHDAGERHGVCGAAVPDFVECGRVHEENDCCSAVLDWILHWEYHR